MQIKKYYFILLFLFSIINVNKGQSLSALEDSIGIYYYNSPYKLIDFVQQAKPLYKAEKNWIYYAFCYYDIADNYRIAGDLEQATIYLDSAILIGKQYNIKPENDFYGYVATSYGFVAIKKGNLSAAEEHFKTSLAIDTIQEYISNQKISTDYNNLANCYLSNGDYEQSITYFKKAQSLANKGTTIDNKVHLIRLYSNIGLSYFSLKKYDLAKENYDKALEILTPQEINDGTANGAIKPLYNNLSDYYRTQKDYEKALLYMQKKANLPNLSPRNFAGIYHRVGLIFTDQKKYQSAIDTLNAALQIRVAALPSKHHLLAETHHAIGDAYYQQKKYDKALDSYQNSIISVVYAFEDKNISNNPSLDKILNQVQLLKSLSVKADILQVTNKSKEALNTYLVCSELIDKMRTSFQHNNSKLLLMEEGIVIYEKSIALALQNGNKEIAYELAEKSKATLLLEAIRGIKARFGLSEELLLKEQKFKADISFFERLIWDETQRGDDKDERSIKGWQNKIFDLKEKYEKLKEQFAQNHPDYYQLQYNTKVVDISTIQKRLLNSKTAMITYFIGNEKVFIFTISKDDIQVTAFDKPSDLNLLISTLRRTLRRDSNIPNAHLAYYEAAYQIYETYLKEAIATLPKSINRLIIIPDNQLNFIPFEALLTTKPTFQNPRYEIGQLDYLIRDYQITYGYSATLLVEGLKKKKEKNLSSFGGFVPYFANGISQQRGCDDAVLGNLPFGRKNIVEINKIMDGRLYFDTSATLGNFKEISNQYKILHLCTHACATSDLKDTRIYFTDQELLAFELYNIPLNARLAVLSACETGIGELKQSEGVMSLARAFMYSGCPSVITSLWSVDDASTSELMLAFYKNLKNGDLQDEALHRAKLDFLEAKGIEASHPYYWSGFIHIGNNEVLFPTFWQQNSTLLIVGFILFALLLFFFYKKK